MVNPAGSITITITDPDHVRLNRGAIVKIGNNSELREAKLGTMPGVWQVTHVYPAEKGQQRYDVETAGINRHHLRALAARKK